MIIKILNKLDAVSVCEKMNYSQGSQKLRFKKYIILDVMCLVLSPFIIVFSGEWFFSIFFLIYFFGTVLLFLLKSLSAKLIPNISVAAGLLLVFSLVNVIVFLQVYGIQNIKINLLWKFLNYNLFLVLILLINYFIPRVKNYKFDRRGARVYLVVFSFLIVAIPLVFGREYPCISCMWEAGMHRDLRIFFMLPIAVILGAFYLALIQRWSIEIRS